MAVTSLISAAEEIRSRCNIVDVVSPLVSIKRAGSNYKCCCLFHKEKTPSFVVSEQKQIFTCFGCGKSGDVIKFIQEYYNLNFPEAVRRLAAQYGIEIDDSYERQSKKKDGYYAINKTAARFFFDAFTKHANPGYDYMKGRGIQPETIAKFGIGYADEGWQTLSDYMLAQGTQAELLTELGLSSRSSKDGRLYDKFRGRVMFPIFNTMGKVIGFGGRTIIGDAAKYLNSQESFVFEKKRNLYGLNLSKTEIQEQGYAILVEGYMDVVGLYQGGVRNVCAALGTALTPEQAQLLKRYTKKAVLCLDSDAAGIKAAIRGCDVLRAAGLDVRVMHVDDGKDPDEYIKKHGADEFRALLDKTAETDIDFKIGLIDRGPVYPESREDARHLGRCAAPGDRTALCGSPKTRAKDQTGECAAGTVRGRYAGSARTHHGGAHADKAVPAAKRFLAETAGQGRRLRQRRRLSHRGSPERMLPGKQRFRREGHPGKAGGQRALLFRQHPGGSPHRRRRDSVPGLPGKTGPEESRAAHRRDHENSLHCRGRGRGDVK